jgi:DNA-binding CsgD family transcriptional regulator
LLDEEGVEDHTPSVPTITAKPCLASHASARVLRDRGTEMATPPGHGKVVRSPRKEGDGGTTTSLDALHSLASSLAVRWGELDDEARLAQVEEIEQALSDLCRRDGRKGQDFESGEGSLIENHLPLLTPRELEVLQAIARGETTRTVAADLAISPLTVRSHIKNLLRKLGVHSRLEAASVLLRFEGWTTVDVD